MLDSPRLANKEVVRAGHGEHHWRTRERVSYHGSESSAAEHRMNG